MQIYVAIRGGKGLACCTVAQLFVDALVHPWDTCL